MEPNHMEFAHLKELAVRLLAVGLREGAESGLIVSVTEALQHVPDETSLENSEQTLTQWLRERRKRARAVITAAVETDAQRAEANALFERIDSLIKASACTACAKQDKSRICAGDAAVDPQQIAERGLCIAVVREIYAYLHAAVGGAIRLWAVDEAVARLTELEVALATSGTRSRAAQISSTQPYQVLGSTLFLDDESEQGRASEVKLAFVVNLVDWRSVIAIPWLLMHELTCHAFQWRDPGRESLGVEEDCAFYEGWMDWLAYEFLAWDCRGGIWDGEPRMPSFLAKHKIDVAEEAFRFREWRYAQDADAATNWRWGAGVAKRALEFFESRHMGSERRRWALRNLLQLSFIIQHYDPGEQVEEIITAVSAVVARATGPALSGAQKDDVRNALLTPSKNLSHWISKLKKLKDI